MIELMGAVFAVVASRLKAVLQVFGKVALHLERLVAVFAGYRGVLRGGEAGRQGIIHTRAVIS